jgi:hypothetical protein
MRIYCPICKMNIVDTTPDFVCGGPYAAGMFKPGARFTAAQYNVAALKSKRPEHLPCPRCKKPFINRDGSLLTEHGLIRAGQTTVDMSFSIVYPAGHDHAGMLKTAQEWSRMVRVEPVEIVPVGRIEVTPHVEGEWRTVEEFREAPKPEPTPPSPKRGPGRPKNPKKQKKQKKGKE